MDINTGKALSKKDSLNQSINLILLTPKGERILNRNFGSNVSSFLGNPIGFVAGDISGEVIASIEENDKRISVDRVIMENNNNSSLKLTVKYNGEGSADVNLT